jgi:hypothetical protein
MPTKTKLENGRIICIPQSTLVANEKATFLSLKSTNDEVRKYFIAVLNLSKSKEKYPVNLDDVWMLVYGRKQEAVRALTSEIFIQDIDYQLLRQNAQNPKGGRPTIEYHLSVSCLEYFIARKVRPVFDVYREVFHKTAEMLPKVSKSSAADKRRIAALEKELERTREALRWTRIIERQEVELKCSCFHYLVKTKQYDKWEEYRRTGIIKR